MTMRDASVLIAGIGLSLPVWAIASWLINADVYAELRDCRSSLSIAIERGEP